MFTGIIEGLAEVISIKEEGTNLRFELTCPFLNELKIDQSLAHDGVCLTIEAINDNTYEVVAVEETLGKTSLRSWGEGTMVNLERSMKADGRFDGHIVQGHVDTVAKVESVNGLDGSWEFAFSYDPENPNETVQKGSICVNGVSLTVVDSYRDGFSVAIIPYTYEHTNFGQFKPGTIVNLEFDIVGKYLKKFLKA